MIEFRENCIVPSMAAMAGERCAAVGLNLSICRMRCLPIDLLSMFVLSVKLSQSTSLRSLMLLRSLAELSR
jgi:hypothetical protein